MENNKELYLKLAEHALFEAVQHLKEAVNIACFVQGELGEAIVRETKVTSHEVIRIQEEIAQALRETVSPSH